MKKVLKNKKSLIAIGLIILGGIIGATIAYFRTSETFPNVFKTKPYSTRVTEIFESPDNWTPGTTTEKKVFAKIREKLMLQYEYV